MPKIRVLLLTNRDSDNVGDQIIEASVVSLLKGVFANLGASEDDFVITSRAAGIVSRSYMRSKDPALLKGARKAISNSDVIVFGGAPLFNYSYQNFYLRTIYTLQLAHEYGVPVLFSSIGVEPFNASNPKSVALKEALALPVVRQITTRDDYASLEQYVEGTDTPIAHVADPAVFADVVFRDVPSAPRSEGKTIGLVVTRAGIFKDNGIDFNEAQQRKLWLDVIALLKKRGYDYRLFTTGHFTDEVFLDNLVRKRDVPASKAVIAVNSPEELIGELSACDGIIAYRLHASITSFAYDIPSVGLTWNFKVPYFYESVGHGERALDHDHWTAEEIVGTLEKAMEEGVHKNEDFLMTVYETLFRGIKSIFYPESTAEPYSYQEVRKNLPTYPGTTPQMYKDKVLRKLRRTYESYHKLADQPAAIRVPAPATSLVRRIKRALTGRK